MIGDVLSHDHHEITKSRDQQIRKCIAPVAQLDRATASGAVGRRFESCRAHTTYPDIAFSSSHYAFVIVRFGDGYRRAAPFRTVPSGCSHPRVGIGWTLRRIEPSSSAARRFTCVGGLKGEQC